MRKFSCLLIYKYRSEIVPVFFKNALHVLGFRPLYMDVFIDENNILYDIEFNESEVFSFLDKGVTTVVLKNQLYDESGNNHWFRFSIDKTYYNVIRLQWLDERLDFLIDSSYFQSLLNPNFLICGYCYDHDDVFLESNTDIRYYMSKNNSSPYATTKNQFGDDIIDVSKNWGRSESACGLEFLAAPLMWFGKSFFEIIPKGDFLKFESGIVKNNNDEMISITLFDLVDLPMKHENRRKQENFWLSFDLKNKIESYRKSHSIDLEKWIKDLTVLNRTKKK
ncbi:MAG TPA: hypothetical protein VK622_09210 [Puia sp.]|nr:hypothetical protein [Puia sp.]